ncbi:MAG TPA: sensor domain-containing diguanylate cyclase [Deinococcales bacterium]|nr:sensor domain-containing diguanylate cyclase [Deinococcales bacterium]
MIRKEGPEGKLPALAGLVPPGNAQESLGEELERFRTIVQRMPDGIVLLDARDPEVSSRIVECNDAFARMNGYTRAELIGRSIHVLLEREAQPGEAAAHFQRLKEDGELRLSGTHVRKDGSVFPIESSTSIINLGGHELVLGIDRDVTERVETERIQRELTERLKQQACHDPLTGLPNRVLFQDHLGIAIEHAKRRGESLAVAFLDLDGFKLVNDTLGHQAGDVLLTKVARRLQGCTRAGDTLCRMGGDEFLLLAPGLRDPAGAERAAQRLLDSLARPFLISGREVRVSASIGISLYPDDTTDSDSLLRDADRAMYRAKAAGKDRIERHAPRAACPEPPARAVEIPGPAARLERLRALAASLERDALPLYGSLPDRAAHDPRARALREGLESLASDLGFDRLDAPEAPDSNS